MNLPYPSHPVSCASIDRCIKSLEAEIQKIDAQYDVGQNAWAQGEMDSFRSEKFLVYPICVEYIDIRLVSIETIVDWLNAVDI